jgi:sulfite exporter TauE/SafE
MRGGKPAMGLAYLLVFGIGSTGGMLIMSCIIGLPFVIGMKLSDRLPSILQLSTAFASVVFGFFYAWQTLS